MGGTTIPGPRGRWFVGDIVSYQADRIGWLIDSRQRYGDVVRLAPRMVVIHDAELAHQVLARTNEVYTIDAALRSTRRERNAVSAYTAEWMRVRRDVWHAVADRVAQLHMHRFVADLAEDLHSWSGHHVDVLAVSRRILGRALVDFCVGAEEDSAVLATFYEAADDLFQNALQALVGGEGRVAWLPRPAARAAADANRRLIGLLTELVDRRLAKIPMGEPSDLLDALLTAQAQPETRQVVSVLRAIMFSSHGVPGTALLWVTLLLAEHTEIRRQISAEVADMPLEAFAGRAALPFTTAVVKEALRLYPPQWLLTRTVVQPTEVGGFRVRAGCEVLVCPFLMHRDTRWWDEPDRFRPARWLGTSQPHARSAYLPFGAGPRICPGSHLAMVHLTTMTALLARDYTFDLPPSATVRMSCDGLLSPVGVHGGWRPRA